jgi:hypothetical protein
VVIRTPTHTQRFTLNTFVPTTISGTVTDDRGVSRVQLKLARTRNGVKQFWNGAAFTTASVFVDATLNGTNWSLTKMPPRNRLDLGGYQVVAFAYDEAGNRAISDPVSFSLIEDSTPPTVFISIPYNNQRVQISNFISFGVKGFVTDNVGVASVKLKLSRTRNGVKQFWNGTAFTTAPIYTDATLNGSVWELTPMPTAEQLDEGVYEAVAFAYDARGNRGHSDLVRVTLFEDSTPPTVSISNPLSNATVDINSFSSGTLNGIAADNLGGVFVQLKLVRRRGAVTEFWDGTSFTTTPALVYADSSNSSTGMNWIYGTDIPASQLDTGPYIVYAYATDMVGNTTASPGRSFNVSGNASVAAPLQNETSSARSAGSS